MPTPAPDGFLARPTSGTGRPVLVLHAWWGLNDALKAFCARLAESGFVAFAPDLYHGRVADTPAGAEPLAESVLQSDRTMEEVASAARFLQERAGDRDAGLAVIGFSLGAYFAMAHSAADPARVRSVVLFYGTRPGDYREAKAAYLGHFAERDDFEPPAEVDKFEASLRDAGRPVTFHRYAGTGHWFFEPDRPDAFDRAAADLAWERTLAFLNRAV
ncbi:MAG TPA: dienelactone hydrolase family protein [Candidatus Eisenbacteria bacterium]|nr:dienelactone hydrolase family protein [Candidatus Eisenbacteria bacterium]